MSLEVATRRSFARAALQHPWFMLVSVTLAAFDFVLIAMHLFVSQLPAQASLGSYHLLRVDIDGSFAERFEHLKLALASLFLAAAAWIARSGRYLAASVCVATLLVDNALMVHERLGGVEERADVAQFAFLALVGSVVLSVGTVACWTAASGERRKLIAVFLALALVGFFAVVVDALHSSIANIYQAANEPLALLEDGGELVSMSVLLAVCAEIFISVRRGRFRRGFGARALRRVGLESCQVTDASGQVEEYRFRLLERSSRQIGGRLATSHNLSSAH